MFIPRSVQLGQEAERPPRRRRGRRGVGDSESKRAREGVEESRRRGSRTLRTDPVAMASPCARAPRTAALVALVGAPESLHTSTQPSAEAPGNRVNQIPIVRENHAHRCETWSQL